MKFEEDSIVSKIGVSVIGLLVFLLFGIGVYFAGLRHIANAVRTGWRASSLIEVPAKITDVQMDHNNTKYGNPGAHTSAHTSHTSGSRILRGLSISLVLPNAI